MFKFHDTFASRIERVISPHLHSFLSMIQAPFLSDDDGSGIDGLPAEDFNSQAFSGTLLVLCGLA